jgi:hypothetical protein
VVESSSTGGGGADVAGEGGADVAGGTVAGPDADGAVSTSAGDDPHATANRHDATVAAIDARGTWFVSGLRIGPPCQGVPTSQL